MNPTPSFTSPNVIPPKSSSTATVIAKVNTAAVIIDPYMELAPAKVQAPSMNSKPLPAVVVNLPPPPPQPVVNTELPKLPAPALAASTPQKPVTASVTDPYMEMEIPANTASIPSSLGKPLPTVQEAVTSSFAATVQTQSVSPPELKPLPDITDTYVARDIDTISEASTAGSSDITQTTTAGTNSSSDSNQTVVIEETNLLPPQANLNFGARHKMNRSPAAARKVTC